MALETAGVMTSTESPRLMVDVLGIDSLWAVLQHGAGVRLVHYMHAARDPVNRLAIRILGRCGWTFVQLDYSLAPVNGASPFKQLTALLLSLMRQCRDTLFVETFQRLTAFSVYERARLSAFFAKQAGIEMFFAVQLYVVMTSGSVRMACTTALFLQDSVFAPLLRELYGRVQVRPHFYRSRCGGKPQPRTGYQMDRVILHKTKRRIHRVLQSVRLFALGGFYGVLGRLSPEAMPARRHKICALVAASPAVERRSCLPWMSPDDGEELKREILAVYGSWMAPQDIAFYRRRCDQAVLLDFDPVRDAREPLLRAAWASYPGVFGRNLKRYRQVVGIDRMSRWMLKNLLEIVIKTSYFESLFRLQGTQVLWTMNEDDSDGWLAAMAAHRVGGVSLGTTWSQPALPAWNIQRNQNDVYFVWGQRMGQIRLASDDPCYAYVIAGYPGDGQFAAARQQAHEYRQRLLQRQGCIRTIASFFNAMPARDALFSPALLREFYQQLFAWLDEDPGNFLIIKAKRRETLCWDVNLQRAIDAYQQAGRLDVLQDLAAVYPALAADVVVGLGATLSLPSLAATLGCAVVLCDPHHLLQDHPIGLPNVTVVSQTSAVRPAMAQIIAGARDGNGPGRLEPRHGSVIDPFVDGQTARRYQQYIQDLLRSLDQGRTGVDAVEAANQRYQARWGAEHLLRGPLGLPRACGRLAGQMT